MNKKYPVLSLISIILKVMAFLVAVVGVGVAIWFLVSAGAGSVAVIITVAIFLGSLITGIVLYAFSELIICVTDIESNTRSRLPNNEVAPKGTDKADS